MNGEIIRNRFPWGLWKRFLGIGSENTGFQSSIDSDSFPNKTHKANSLRVFGSIFFFVWTVLHIKCTKLVNRLLQSNFSNRFIRISISHYKTWNSDFLSHPEQILHESESMWTACNWILFDFTVFFFFLFRLPNIILTESKKKTQMHNMI